MSFAPLHLPVHVLVGSLPDCACVGITGRYTDWYSRMSLDLCGSASSLVFALRGKLPLRDVPEVVDGVSYRVQPPPDLREAELSTWSVHRSYPTVGCRRHGIVQHLQRKPTSVWRRTLTSFGFSAVSVSSFFYAVCLLRLLYAPVYVDLPLLPTFIDPPWVSLSHHPARFDQPVVHAGTLLNLHLLVGPTSTSTSAITNCPFGGSLACCWASHLRCLPTYCLRLHASSQCLPSLSPWQSSALYYDCFVPSTSLGLVPAGPVVPTVYNSNLLWFGDILCWPHGNIMGGSLIDGVYFWGSGLLGKILWGEKMILYWIKRCSVYLLLCLLVASMGGASTWKFSSHEF